MCAGISSSSTHGTASYLARSWRDLHDRFGSDDFLVVLSCPDQEPDSHLIQAPQELPDFERRSPPGARSRATVGMRD